MRAQTFLHNMNLTALPEIEAAIAVARLSRRELLAAPNLGRGAVDAIAAWLGDHGRKLQLELTLRPMKSGAPARGRPSYSDDDPSQAGRNKTTTPCPYPTTDD
jgi:hypothetical protein